MGDRVNFQSTVNFPAPSSTWIDWHFVNFDTDQGTVTVTFDYRDASGIVIVGGKINQVEVFSGTDYTDIVGFTIRAQDVGTAIGRGLKQLIINKIKARLVAKGIITAGNDMTLV